MKFSLRRALLSASALSLVAAPNAVMAQQTNAPEDDRSDANELLTDTIIVTAAKTDSLQADTQSPPEQVAIPADAAGIAARTPGGALVQNRPLSGQLSYRGLFGERVLGRINGQRSASGVPNAMDPPLLYAPSILVDRIEITRGTAPVSQGPSLSAAVNAQLVGTRFSDTGELAANAYAAGQYRSVDNSYAIGGQIGIATPRWRLGVIGSREEGEDYDYAGGTAAGTSFERQLYGVEGASVPVKANSSSNTGAAKPIRPETRLSPWTSCISIPTSFRPVTGGSLAMTSISICGWAMWRSVT